MAKEFSLDDADFTKKEEMDFEQLPIVRPSEIVAVDSMGICEGGENGNQNGSDVMECEESESESEEEEQVSSQCTCDSPADSD